MAFQMPDDLKGKSIEEIAEALSTTRADYDRTQSEYKAFKEQWEPRSKTWDSYEQLGKPDELDAVVKWGRTYAPLIEKIAKGEAKVLNDADYKAFENWSNQTRNGTAPREPAVADDDPLLVPLREQLSKSLEERFTKMIDDRSKQFGGQFQTAVKQLQDQMNLYGHVSQLRQQYPKLDFNDLLKKGADLASMPPEKLLQELITTQSKLSGVDAEVEKRVAEKLAAAETNKEASTVKALLETRQSGNYTPGKPKREDIVRGLVGELSKKFPGIFEQMPVL